jgi:UDP-N-acetylmuramate dehydrogenase
LALTNSGGAKAEDIVQLAKASQKRVMEKFGIELKAEVQMIGINL